MVKMLDNFPAISLFNGEPPSSASRTASETCVPEPADRASQERFENPVRVLAQKASA